MSPPINLDGDTVDAITMDGDSVGEVTVDGSTVFSAISDAAISRFEFEDSSQFSTLVDDRDGNDGTLNSGTYVTGGVEFNGTTDNGTVPNAAIPFGSGEFSVALLFNSTDSGTDAQTHFGLRDSDGSSVLAIQHDNGNLQVDRFDGSVEDITTSVDLRDGNDHLVVIAEDSSGAELFTDNGNSRGTGGALTFDFSGEDPGVGRRGGGGGADRNSAMTALRLDTYDKRLTSSDVSNLWNTGSI